MIRHEGRSLSALPCRTFNRARSPPGAEVPAWSEMLGCCSGGVNRTLALQTGLRARVQQAEILDYRNASLAHLGKAIDAIGDKTRRSKSSPISPLPATATTRLALTVGA